MIALEVGLESRSYPIYIDTDLLGRSEFYRAALTTKQVLVVSNPTIAAHWLAPCLAGLTEYSVETLLLPDGEAYKTLDTLNIILTKLLELRFDRRCTLVALGGGVIGDITGFAAAVYQRGVEFIQIPTTLLAQVDSSVGGKTAVNHPLGKNMIGAFHQPRLVLADLGTLATLPPREYAAGLAEVIKYGLIRDANFFAWLEQHMADLVGREPGAVAEAVARSCRIKAEIVGVDEREAGLREILNLGHTFGHAIETAVGYGTWLHGEAVAAGMLLAVDLSQRLGYLGSDVLARTERLIARAGLPTRRPSGLDAATMIEHMRIDKKARDGQIRLVLLKQLGSAVVTADYPPGHLQASLDACV